jgi:hypothetical protein
MTSIEGQPGRLDRPVFVPIYGTAILYIDTGSIDAQFAWADNGHHCLRCNEAAPSSGIVQ